MEKHIKPQEISMPEYKGFLQDEAPTQNDEKSKISKK